MGALTYSTNPLFSHADGMGYYEQFSQLWPHSNLNRIRVKNSGTDSTFESLLNVKRGLNLAEKSSKFPKILS